MILAGDIGGTKTALGIYSHEAGVGSPLAQETFSSANYAGLEAIATEFLSNLNFKFEKSIFGVAGPWPRYQRQGRDYQSALGH